MSDDHPAGAFPLHEVMDVFERVAGELRSDPQRRDLATVLARGDGGKEAMVWGDVAWAALPDSHVRVAYMAHAALADEDVSAAIGSLPEDVALRVAAVSARVGQVMEMPAQMADKLCQEELARQLAASLELPIAGENKAASRFLLSSMDSVSAALEARKQEFDAAYRRAVSLVDSKHRPARPYGE